MFVVDISGLLQLRQGASVCFVPCDLFAGLV